MILNQNESNSSSTINCNVNQLEHSKNNSKTIFKNFLSNSKQNYSNQPHPKQNYPYHHHILDGNQPITNFSCNQRSILDFEDNDQSLSSKNSSQILTINTPDSGITQSRDSLNSSSLNNDKSRKNVSMNKNFTEMKNHQINNSFNVTLDLKMKTSVNLDYFSNEKTQFSFLTATQLQRIIDHFKRQFKKKHFLHDSNSMSNCFNLIKNDSTNLSNLSVNQSKSSKDNLRQQNQTSSCFGCSLETIEKKSGGLILPTLIEFMILYLMKNGVGSVGVFRKSGVKSRILTLRKHCDLYYNLNHNLLSNSSFLNLTDTFISNENLKESKSFKQSKQKSSSNQNPPFVKLANLDELFAEYSIYDIADTIKTWLREIKPKPLISNDIILAFKDYSKKLSTKEEFFFYIISLITDCERYILFIILNMLSWFAVNSKLNQMTAYNLAICFAPSLCEIVKLEKNFNLLSYNFSNNFISSNLPNKNQTKLDISSSKLNKSTFSDYVCINENEFLQDAQKCLEFLIENYHDLDLFNSSTLPFSLNVSNTDTSLAGYDNNNGYIYLLNEGNLLPQKYETNVLVNGSPVDILERLLYERNLLDPTIIEWEIEDANTVNDQNDFFIMKKQCSIFLPVKTFTLTRKWSYLDSVQNNNDLSFQSSSKKSSKESSKLKDQLSKKEHQNFTQQNILLKEEGFLYQSVYTIIANSEGKSLVQQSVAYDLKGYSFHWYQHVFPNMIDYQLQMLKQSFQVDYLTLKNIRSSNI